MDHAGIATQAKVEARLAESGISRYDLGRENSLIKSGMERRVCDDYQATMGQDGALGRATLVSVSPLDEGCQSRSQGLCRALQKVGFTVVNLSSTGIKSSYSPF